MENVLSHKSKVTGFVRYISPHCGSGLLYEWKTKKQTKNSVIV